MNTLDDESIPSETPERYYNFTEPRSPSSPSVVGVPPSPEKMKDERKFDAESSDISAWIAIVLRVRIDDKQLFSLTT